MTIAPRMLSAVAIDAFVVRVLFADGEVRDVDLSVDDETRTVTWPNGADLDPDVIYTPESRRR